MARLNIFGNDEDDKKLIKARKESMEMAKEAPKEMAPISVIKKEEVAKTAVDKNAAMKSKLGKAAAALSLAKQAGVMPEASPTSTVGGAASGALSGAATGSAFGPKGALVGAAVGGVTGALKAKSARKAAKRQAEAAHQRRLADIEREKTMRLQSAFQSLSGAFGQSLL